MTFWDSCLIQPQPNTNVMECEALDLCIPVLDQNQTGLRQQN